MANDILPKLTEAEFSQLQYENEKYAHLWETPSFNCLTNKLRYHEPAFFHAVMTEKYNHEIAQKLLPTLETE